MKDYIRFEIEVHRPISKNRINGIFLDDKGKEKSEFICSIYGFQGKENDEMLQKLCNQLNHISWLADDMNNTRN